MRTGVPPLSSGWSVFANTQSPSTSFRTSAVLLFLVGLVVATGIGFGMAPALMGSRFDPGASFAIRSRGIVSRRRFSHALVTLQVAVSLLLLVGAGLFVSSFRNLYTTDRGFAPDHVILVDLQNNPRRTDPESLTRVAEDIHASVAGLAGVESASVSWIQLFSGRDQRMRLGFPASRRRPVAGFISNEGIVPMHASTRSLRGISRRSA